MIKNKKILAIIPARGGSKGIPKKNIIDFCGQPMIAYSINAARQSKYADKILISSDSEEILSISERYGAQIIKRPEELAQDRSKMDDAIKHVLATLEQNEQFRPDFIVLLQPTSPLRTAETIDKAVEAFSEVADNFDSLIPLFPVTGKIGVIKDGAYKKLQGEPGKQRQELESYYKECGTIFIFKPDLINAGKFYGDRIYPFIIEREAEAVDIDNFDDLEYAKYFKIKMNK